MQLLTKRLNILVNSILLLSLAHTAPIQAQDSTKVSLAETWKLAENNYPSLKQLQLINQIEELTVKSLSSSLYPQLSFNGQATYQSDVTSVDLPIPGVKTPSQSKDQYRVTADVTQVIYDGGQNSAQKNIQRLNTKIEESKIEVELYEVKDRITKLFFNILYQDQLKKQAELLLRDIRIGIDKTRPQVEQALVLRSNLQVLEAQFLVTEQRLIEIRNTRQGLTETLSRLTGFPFDERTVFIVPAITLPLDSNINRPELKVFQSQLRWTQGQEKLIQARNTPKVSVFLQGGYGKPGLNLLSNSFDMFYIGGLRFNWSLNQLYNNKRDRKVIDLNMQRINLQKETFVLNTATNLRQIKAEVSKYAELVASDQQIINIRSKVVESSKAQLENAVITANDYLREVNAADQARLSLSIHQLLLLQATINYQITSGKL